MRVFSSVDAQPKDDRSHGHIASLFSPKTAVAVLAITLAFSSANTRPARSQAAVDIVKVNIDIVAKGYRASRLIGVSVTNDKNERIGTIDDIIIDKNRALYAVLQVGGFLALGGHLVVVQFDQLKIDDNGKKIQLPGATKDPVRNLNEFHYSS